MLSVRSAQAKVMINEFFSATTDDWIELYNDSDSETNLSGYILEDSTSEISSGKLKDLIFPPHAYCEISVGKRLDKDGDIVYLKNGADQVDCVSYGDGNGEYCSGEEADVVAPSEIQTGARQPNASATWVVGSATKGFSNNETIKPEGVSECYLPTPAPTATPSPTPTPTSTSTPTPTPTLASTIPPTTRPTSSSTPASTHKAEASEPQNNLDDARAVLAASTESPTTTDVSDEPADGMRTIVIIALIFGGVLCFAGAGYPFYKPYLKKLMKVKKEYNDTHDQQKNP